MTLSKAIKAARRQQRLSTSRTATRRLLIEALESRELLSVFAENDSYPADEDSSAQIDAPGVLANDHEDDGCGMYVTHYDDPAHGTLTQSSSDGSFVYVPSPYFSGTDSFTYTVSNFCSDDQTATVTITVQPVNHAPVPSNDNYVVMQNTQRFVDYPGVLSNDTDVDRDTLTAHVVTGPSHASAFSLSSNGSFWYTPASQFVGTDSFTYVTNDGTTDSDTAATVYLDVRSPSQPQLVADINPGPACSCPNSRTVLNGFVYFGANNGSSGYELFKSNGTALGTSLVKDINPGPSSGFDSSLGVLNGQLLFSANDGVHGLELWKTDGTINGTVQVKDIRPGSAGSYIYQALVINGTMFFLDMTANAGLELWKTDGTEAGTVLVKQVVPDNSYLSTIPYMTNLNGKLFFATQNFNATVGQLWMSDGTAAGTVSLGQFQSNDGPMYLTAYNGALYFLSHGQLWRSDTSGGTYLVKTFQNGVLRYLTLANNTLYFTVASATSDTPGLWRSDGTASGTSLVRALYWPQAADSADSSRFTNMNGILYFTADASYQNHGPELWRSDGTGSGTYEIVDLYPGWNSSSPGSFTPLNGRLYFTANDGTHGSELWMTDGTSSGTRMVTEINPGSAGSNPWQLFNFNGTLFFGATTSTTGLEPWVIPVPSHAPNGTNSTVTAVENTPYMFSDSDFGFSDPYDSPPNSFVAIKITALPGAGSLKDGNNNVTLGQRIPITDIKSGKLSFTPAHNAVGSAVDQISFKVQDDGGTMSGGSDTDPASKSIVFDVIPWTGPPVAINDIYTTPYQTPLNVSAPGITGNDVHSDASQLTATKLSNPAHGTLTSFSSNGGFTYVPEVCWSGTVSFTYKINDGQADSNIATVTITVSPNQPPVAEDDAYTTTEDVPLTIAAPGVFTNDHDPEGQTLTATKASNPSHGIVTQNLDGSFTYTPNTDYYGPDSFTYTTSDGSLDSDIATVSITVVAKPDIAIDSFTSDSHDLTLTYSVSRGLASPFKIALYASSDGVSLDHELQDVSADSFALGTHTQTISASFDDPLQDYYLIAVVDSDNDVAEFSELNNTAVFEGGAFLNKFNGLTTLEVHGTDNADSIDVSPFSDQVHEENIQCHDETIYPQWVYWYTQYPQHYDEYTDDDGNWHPDYWDPPEPVDYYHWDPPEQETQSVCEDVGPDHDRTGLRLTMPQTYSSAIDYILTIDQTEYLTIDQVNIRSHGGDDTVSANGAPTWIFGGAGNDTLTGATDFTNYINGGSGDNVITAGNAGDVIFAGDGENTITGGSGGDYIAAGDGDNTITGGAGDDIVIAGNGNNTIQGGDGNDNIYAGNGNNTIQGGIGDDVVDTGSGDNDIDAGSGNDEVNGLAESPTIQIMSDPEVQEGSLLSVVVWLSQYTDHDVSATISIQSNDGPGAAGRWQQTQVPILIPAHEGFVSLSLGTVDDNLLNGDDVYTLSLLDPNGAELGDESSSPVTLLNDDNGIWLRWSDPYTDFIQNSRTLLATPANDGSLIATATDDEGHDFTVRASLDQSTGTWAIRVTVQGVPSDDRDWNGTSFGSGGGYFDMGPASAMGIGQWALVQATKQAPKAAVTCRIPPLQVPGPPPAAKSTTVEALSVQKGKALNDVGSAQSVIKWATSIQNGWIVQHVNVTEYFQIGNIGPIKHEKEFWEGWQIVDGVIYAGWKDKGADASPLDIFSTKGSLGGSCGIDIATGRAKVMQNYDDEVKTWVKVQESGKLPSTGKPPKDWSDADTAYHELVTEWNDIDVPKKKTAIVRESP